MGVPRPAWVHAPALRSRLTLPQPTHARTCSVVTIRGITIKPCPDEAAAMALFTAGNEARHVGSTGMNAESSRSHLVFALL